MIDHLLRFAFPAAFALLPPALESQAASVLLLTIALHTTGLTSRRPSSGSRLDGGPWRGLWALQRGEVRSYSTTGGLAAIMGDPVRQAHLCRLMGTLGFAAEPPAEVLRVVYAACEFNDVVGAGAARLMLPESVPLVGDAEGAYAEFEKAWHPASEWHQGRVNHERWKGHYAAAMTAVTALKVVAP